MRQKNFEDHDEEVDELDEDEQYARETSGHFEGDDFVADDDEYPYNDLEDDDEEPYYPEDQEES